VVDTYRYAGASESVVEIATGGGKPHLDSIRLGRARHTSSWQVST